MVVLVVYVMDARMDVGLEGVIMYNLLKYSVEV